MSEPKRVQTELKRPYLKAAMFELIREYLVETSDVAGIFVVLADVAKSAGTKAQAIIAELSDKDSAEKRKLS